MRILLTTLTLFISTLLIAQAPALIPYQAAARDASGQPLANTNVNARFTIHDGSATGASVWQELQTVSTSALGLFTVQLGSSVPLTGVNWSDGSKFMQVEIDLGSGFVDIGTQQLLSVPYALHAGSVRLDVSATGDTLFVGDGSFAVVPGISEANNDMGNVFTSGTTQHTCGSPYIHNPDLVYGSMIDQEGISYKTIVIGTQEWMAENLNTGIYRNGDSILGNLSQEEWSALYFNENGAWTYYLDAPNYSCPHGKLYNWYACADERGLCPTGWHVPSYSDWFLLINYLGGESVAGGKMKTVGTFETGSNIWFSPNVGATNSSGFSGIASGLRANDQYLYIRERSDWWSSTDETAPGVGQAWTCLLDHLGEGAYLNWIGKSMASPVRCLKD